MDKSGESKENQEQWAESVETEQEKGKELVISLESDTLSSGSSCAGTSSQVEPTHGKRIRCASTSSDTSEIQSCLRYDPEESQTPEVFQTFKLPPRRPMDEIIIQRRLKQIEYGKNTSGYANYRKLVPKNKRKKTDPRTPDIYAVKSRRGFDNEIKNWRRALHLYDDTEAEDEKKKE